MEHSRCFDYFKIGVMIFCDTGFYTIVFIGSSDQAYFDKRLFRMNLVQLADTFYSRSFSDFFLTLFRKKEAG